MPQYADVTCIRTTGTCFMEKKKKKKVHPPSSHKVDYDKNPSHLNPSIIFMFTHISSNCHLMQSKDEYFTL